MLIAKSGDRPLEIEVKRTTSGGGGGGESGGGAAQQEERKKAMAAAADAREAKTNKKWGNPTAKPTKRPIDLSNNTKTYDHDTSGEPQSEEARRAVERAKEGERAATKRLGYNPYEAVKSGSGKGAQGGDAAAPAAAPSPAPSPAPVSSPSFPAAADDGDDSWNDAEIPDDFSLALMKVVSQPEKAAACLKTSHKLLTNAVSKGKGEGGAKFRTVRTNNSAVQERVLSVSGAEDLLVAAGFERRESEEGEPVLVFPEGGGERWLEKGMEAMLAMLAQCE